MKCFKITRDLLVLGIGLLTIGLSGCGREEPSATGTSQQAAPATSAKIPVTTSSKEARGLFLEGRSLLDNLHRTESRPKFEQAVEYDPDFATAYVFLAASASTAAQFFDAIEQAEAHASSASKGEQLVIQAAAAGARNDQDTQLQALTELVSLYPKDARAHMGLANYYSGQSDFSSAAKHYGHAVAINPQMAAAYNAMGYAKRNNDDLEGAKAAFAKYVELIPDEANPYDSYAELLMEMGQYDASIENYRKALAIDANFASSYAGISIDQSLKGDADAAQAAAAEMLAVARSPAERQAALLSSVTAYLFAGDTDAAMAAAEKTYADAEGSGNHAAMGGIREYMGDIMLLANNTDKALEYFSEALSQRQQADINEENKIQAERTHLFKSAITAMVAGDMDTAASTAAEYKAAAEASGTAFERRRVRELAGYLAMNDEDKSIAVTELAQANQLNPIVLYWSAVANKNAGDIEKARDLANRAATRNTLSPNLPFFRKQALQLLDELDAT